MPLPTAASFLGVAKEATKGTGVAATAFIPVTSLTPHDVVTYLADGAMRGAPVDVYNEIAGPISSTFSIEGPAYPDTLPWWLVGILGDLATVGASAPFAHTIAATNSGDFQPRAMTLTDFYGFTGTHSKQYPGNQVSDLSLKFDAAGLLTYTAACSGFASALVAKPTQSFTTIPPYPAWLGAVTIGGSSTTKLESAEIDLKRSVTIVDTVDGTQAPYAVWVGPVQVTGKLTFVHEDDTELIRYLTNTQPAAVFNFTTGASTALTQIQATMTKCAYTDATYERGKDYVETSVSFTALGNTTDAGATGGYSPIKFVCQNAVAASIYA